MSGDEEVEWSGWEKAIGLVLLPLLMMVEGMLVSKLWSWFVVPLGVRPITTAEAVGIGIIGLLICGKGIKPPDQSLVAMLIDFFVKVLFFWAIAALFHFQGGGLP